MPLSGGFRALCIGVALAICAPQEARAAADASAVLTADIPAQPLAQALDLFAQQTGLHLVYVSELVRNRMSHPVDAGLSADKALARLLQGTGLKFEFLTARSIRILAAGAPIPTAQSLPNATNEATSERLREVIVSGTRQLEFKAADGAAPIQVLSAETLTGAAGQPDLVRTLAAIVPSLTAQSFGFDTANATLLSRLRGLSPNHVLILIDGKRRHPTANLDVSPGAFDGGAGADLSLIPLVAIDHVEVLTEGSAAQYGSDAIAGVVNIILKKGSAGGELSTTYGGYYDGGGITREVSGNVGLEPWTGSYLNLTGELRSQGFSNRSGIDPNVTNPANVYPDTNQRLASEYPYLDKIDGDGHTQVKIAALNFGSSLGDDWAFYANATYGVKDVRSYERYRQPSWIGHTNSDGSVTWPYPYGFSPEEASHEIDYGLTSGVRGKVDGWDWDLSTTYGSDDFEQSVIHSSNGILYIRTGASPTDFYAGRLIATQWTSNLDLNRDVAVGLATPLNLSFGTEYRRDSYTIEAGSPSSYILGGAQGFSGFEPTDAGTHARTNYAAYAELASKPIARLLLDATVRFEHYSDFGRQTIGKFTARYDFSRLITLRGAVSTGFRAPTFAEAHYRITSNAAPHYVYSQLAPDSAPAALLGLPTHLQPETSRNYSIGLVFNPSPRLTAGLDLYQIDLRNRIVSSGLVYGRLGGTLVSQDVLNAILASGVDITNAQDVYLFMFLNGADTRTRGADLTLDLPVDYRIGRIDWSLGATFAQTTLTHLATGTPQLRGQAFFDATAISDLTTAAPRFTLNLGSLWTEGPLTVDLREQIFGPSNEWQTDNGDTNGNSPIFYNTRIGTTAITNLDLSYRLTRHVALDCGAKNLFNRYPTHTNGTLLYFERRALDNFAADIYPAFSPYGFDGGYYFVRARLQF